MLNKTRGKENVAGIALALWWRGEERKGWMDGGKTGFVTKAAKKGG